MQTQSVPPLTTAAASGATSRKRSKQSAFRRALPAYLFMLPAVTLFVVWTLYPLISAFRMSFYEWNLIKPSRFVGIDNYHRALTDPIFWMAFRNTLFYVVDHRSGADDHRAGDCAAPRRTAAGEGHLPHGLLRPGRDIVGGCFT